MGAGEADNQRHAHLDLLHGKRAAHPARPRAWGWGAEEFSTPPAPPWGGERRGVRPGGAAGGPPPPADIEEVRRLPAGMLDHVHGRHGETGAVDDAAD